MNVLVGIAHMWQQEFTRNALVAGTALAVAAGVVGYFLVLRSQVFTADALGHVAFTGALVALAGGGSARAGVFVATIAVALVLGVVGQRGRADDVVIGSTLAWILGIGVLALAVFRARHGTGNGAAGVNALFGSIYGLDAGAARTAAAVALGVVVLLALAARPLLFASVDAEVAAARGVPIRLLGLALLVAVALTAAEAVQAVGALLLLGLLAAPAAAAMRLTARPFVAMALAPALAVTSVWAGLGASYAAPDVPPSFGIIGSATAIYAITAISGRRRAGGR